MNPKTLYQKGKEYLKQRQKKSSRTYITLSTYRDQDNMALVKGWRHRLMERIQRLEIDLHMQGQLIADKDVMTIQYEKD